jgi:hypothetical protein
VFVPEAALTEGSAGDVAIALADATVEAAEAAAVGMTPAAGAEGVKVEEVEAVPVGAKEAKAEEPKPARKRRIRQPAPEAETAGGEAKPERKPRGRKPAGEAGTAGEGE